MRLKCIKLMSAPAVGLFQGSFSLAFWKCCKEWMTTKLLLPLLLDFFFLIVPDLKAGKLIYV